MNEVEAAERISNMHERLDTWLETKDQIEDRHPGIIGRFYPENLQHLGSGCLLLAQGVVEFVKVTPAIISKYLRERS